VLDALAQGRTQRLVVKEFHRAQALPVAFQYAIDTMAARALYRNCILHCSSRLQFLDPLRQPDGLKEARGFAPPPRGWFAFVGGYPFTSKTTACNRTLAQ
jgi:hypothetical protein